MAIQHFGGPLLVGGPNKGTTLGFLFGDGSTSLSASGQKLAFMFQDAGQSRLVTVTV